MAHSTSVRASRWVSLWGRTRTVGLLLDLVPTSSCWCQHVLFYWQELNALCCCKTKAPCNCGGAGCSPVGQPLSLPPGKTSAQVIRRCQGVGVLLWAHHHHVNWLQRRRNSRTERFLTWNRRSAGLSPNFDVCIFRHIDLWSQLWQ